jgi:hypothetical protein
MSVFPDLPVVQNKANLKEVSSVKWEGPGVESANFTLGTSNEPPYGVNTSRAFSAKQSQFALPEGGGHGPPYKSN